MSTYDSNGQKKSVEYVIGSEVVGYRWFREDGVIGAETPEWLDSWDYVLL